MTMLELDQTTAEEYSMFLVDGELEVDEEDVVDILEELSEIFGDLLNESN